MMAAYLLKPLVAAEHEPRWLRVYMRWAAWCVKHRGLTALAAGAFLGLAGLDPFAAQGLHTAR